MESVWEYMEKKLPTSATPEGVKERKRIWNDVLKLRHLSLSDCERYLRTTGGLPKEILQPKLIREAFCAARGLYDDIFNEKVNLDDDYVLWQEFRHFFTYLKIYFISLALLGFLDDSKNIKLSFEEFNRCYDFIKKKWKVNIKNPQEAFKMSGSGDFNQFCFWAFKEIIEADIYYRDADDPQDD